MRSILKTHRLAIATAALCLAAFRPTFAQLHDTPQNLPVTHPAPSPGQILFAGRVIDGVAPEVHRLTPALLMKRAITHPLPAFPATTRLHAGSFLQVLVLVGADGAVASILGTDGPQELTTAASAAVQQWTFQPFPGKDASAQMVGTVNLLFTPQSSSDPAQVVLLPNLIRVSGGVLAGNNTHKVVPSGVHGVTVLQVVIDPRGAVAAVTPISGPMPTREAMIDAVSQWRYRPYLLNGEPTWVQSTVSVAGS